ncbi:MAG: LysE family translocator [Bosea sp. (in: a-proteobacteria)]
MNLDLLMALVVFAFVSSITPGPNNMMLLASGVNFGFRRSVPHMLGIGIGFMVLLLCVGLGLGQVLERFPVIYTTLKYVGAAYMLWLAWKIARSGPMSDQPSQNAGSPMTFVGAAAFQWVNPKAWVMAVSAMATYTTPSQYLFSVILVTLIFGAVNIPSVSTWTVFGVGLRRFLADPKLCRIFNIAMALALVASLWPLVREWL